MKKKYPFLSPSLTHTYRQSLFNYAHIISDWENLSFLDIFIKQENAAHTRFIIRQMTLNPLSVHHPFYYSVVGCVVHSVKLRLSTKP